jgi:hypothetical protein
MLDGSTQATLIPQLGAFFGAPTPYSRCAGKDD